MRIWRFGCHAPGRQDCFPPALLCRSNPAAQRIQTGITRASGGEFAGRAAMENERRVWTSRSMVDNPPYPH
eukprot:1161220-Pelagomonas_calceolata.AAC.1